jgi:hypothetical protein
MTKPEADYQSFHLVYAARATCARCDKLSPVVWFHRAKSGQRDHRNYLVRREIAEAMAAEGWELNTRLDKSFCPTCKRIGKP